MNTLNGNNGNGNGNGSSIQKADGSPVIVATDSQKPSPQNLSFDNSSFEQPVILQQSPFLSRTIVWGIIGVTTGLVAWSCFAKIEEAVLAQGQLEPIATVQPVQAPVGGVVKTIHVEDGKSVKKGDLLLSLEPTVPKSQLASLQSIRTALLQETQFYRMQMKQPTAVSFTSIEATRFNLKPELVSLTKSRNALAAENQLYRAELNGLSPKINLSAEERQRLESSLAESSSRLAAAELETAQLERQIRENQVRRSGNLQVLLVSQRMVKDIQSKANAKVAQLEKQLKQNQSNLAAARQIFSINQGILDDIKPVADEGALSRVQLLRQQQEVTTQQSRVAQLEQEELRLQQEKAEAQADSQVEILRQQEQINIRKAEINQLNEEYQRLKLVADQAREKYKNTGALSKKDLLSKIADNDKRIAEIDSQLTKAIVENEKRISEIDSQISQARLNLNYQELRSPVNGTVFDLKAYSPGFVANSTEPVLKIVPTDNMLAKVFITNKDIGFVKEGMDVDVRIDSFPFSEFGDIKGKLVWIGSDALPPDQVHQFYRFPAKVRLDRQSLNINGRQIVLQSGMSLSANIKVRNRTVMSIFTDLFTKNIDNLKFVR